jgi:hypothetical protein
MRKDVFNLFRHAIGVRVVVPAHRLQPKEALFYHMTSNEE